MFHFLTFFLLCYVELIKAQIIIPTPALWINITNNVTFQNLGTLQNTIIGGIAPVNGVHGYQNYFSIFSDSQKGFVFGWTDIGVSFGHDSYLDLGGYTPASSFSFVTWIKMISYSDASIYTTGDVQHANLMVTNNGVICFGLFAATNEDICSPNTLSIGVWTHFAHTYSNLNIQMFQNGQLLILAQNNTFSNAYRMSIGNAFLGDVVGVTNNYAQAAYYYQTMFFNSVLSNNQILALSTGQLPSLPYSSSMTPFSSSQTPYSSSQIPFSSSVTTTPVILPTPVIWINITTSLNYQNLGSYQPTLPNLQSTGFNPVFDSIKGDVFVASGTSTRLSLTGFYLSNTFSFSSWIYLTATCSSYCFIFGDNQEHAGLFFDVSEIIYITSTYGTSNINTGSTTFSTGVWFYLTYVYNNVQNQIYSNGNLVTLTNPSYSLPTGGMGPISLGSLSYIAQPAKYYETMFFNVALTTTQITALYNGQQPTPVFLYSSSQTPFSSSQTPFSSSIPPFSSSLTSPGSDIFPIDVVNTLPLIWISVTNTFTLRNLGTNGEGSFSTTNVQIIPDPTGAFTSIFSINTNSAYVDLGGFLLTQAFTFTSWIYLTSSVSDGVLFSSNGQLEALFVFQGRLYISSTYSPNFYTVNPVMTLNQWLYITCISNGASILIYLNGILLPTTNINQGPLTYGSTAGSVVLGSISDYPPIQPAYFSNTMFFDYALTLTQIQALYYAFSLQPFSSSSTTLYSSSQTPISSSLTTYSSSQTPFSSSLKSTSSSQTPLSSSVIPISSSLTPLSSSSITPSSSQTPVSSSFTPISSSQTSFSSSNTITPPPIFSSLGISGNLSLLTNTSYITNSLINATAYLIISSTGIYTLYQGANPFLNPPSTAIILWNATTININGIDIGIDSTGNIIKGSSSTLIADTTISVSSCTGNIPCVKIISLLTNSIIWSSSPTSIGSILPQGQTLTEGLTLHNGALRLTINSTGSLSLFSNGSSVWSINSVADSAEVTLDGNFCTFKDSIITWCALPFNSFTNSSLELYVNATNGSVELIDKASMFVLWSSLSNSTGFYAISPITSIPTTILPTTSSSPTNATILLTSTSSSSFFTPMVTGLIAGAAVLAGIVITTYGVYLFVGKNIWMFSGKARIYKPFSLSEKIDAV